MCFNRFIQFASERQESLVISTKAVYPEGSRGSSVKINLNIVRVLIGRATIDVPLNPCMCVFPRREECIRRMKISMIGVVWQSRKQNMGLESVFEEAINTRTNLVDESVVRLIQRYNTKAYSGVRCHPLAGLGVNTRPDETRTTSATPHCPKGFFRSFLKPAITGQSTQS